MSERGTIHVAGEYISGLQRCTRCDAVICDDRDAQVPEGQGFPSGFATGIFVSIYNDGGFLSAGRQDDADDCDRTLQ